jgi:hypothetical protein
MPIPQYPPNILPLPRTCHRLVSGGDGDIQRGDPLVHLILQRGHLRVHLPGDGVDPQGHLLDELVDLPLLCLQRKGAWEVWCAHR